MVYSKFRELEKIDVENIKTIVKNVISFLENKYLKECLLVLEKNITDINFIRYEIKKIYKVIIDSFDYREKEVEIVLELLEYIENAYNLVDRHDEN